MISLRSILTLALLFWAPRGGPNNANNNNAAAAFSPPRSPSVPRIAAARLPCLPSPSPSSTQLSYAASTVEAPAREQTERRTSDDQEISRRTNDNDGDTANHQDLEYLLDASESRELTDPYHILLLGATFDRSKVTVPYVSAALEYVLTMPRDDAVELSAFARDHGVSCLGTWPRAQCLSLGKQLQYRDLVCRVVPYCDGGQRGWQARDASAAGAAAGRGGGAGAARE